MMIPNIDMVQPDAVAINGMKTNAVIAAVELSRAPSQSDGGHTPDRKDVHHGSRNRTE